MKEKMEQFKKEDENMKNVRDKLGAKMDDAFNR